MAQSAAVEATPELLVEPAEVLPDTVPDAGLVEAAPRTRRSVIAAAFGGLAGMIGHGLATAEPAAAANGDALLLGQTNSATAFTQLNSTSYQGLIVYGANHGIEGKSNGATGKGVVASASNGAGKNYGVYAHAFGAEGIGVQGTATNNSVGVLGHSHPNSIAVAQPPTQKKTGVYGFAVQDAEAVGVLGEAAAGLGVKGKATTGSGVYGTTQVGTGVFGYSASGVAGRFQTSAALTGVALHTIGRVKFDKSVGRVTIAAGTRSVIVTPGIDLTATSAAVATLQGSANGAIVERVAIDVTANTLTIFLTKNTTVAVSVAWHVFG